MIKPGQVAADIIAEYYEKQLKKGKRGGANLPALARGDKPFMKTIKADPGKLFVSRDVIALEPTITAELSQDKRYLYATYHGIGKRPYYDGEWLMIDDIYLMSASRFPTTKDVLREIFNRGKFYKDKNGDWRCEIDGQGESFADLWLVDPDAVKDALKKPIRGFSKVACLGIGYGMGARKFRTTSEEAGTPIDYKTAKGTITAYWDGYEGLKALRDTLSWTAKRKGAVVNPFGYRCTPEPHKAFNAYIQSSASGVLDVYILKLFSEAPWLEFVALIHDEVIFQCPKDRIAEARTIADLCEKSLNEDLGWSVPIRFGWKEAETFAEIK